MDFNWPEISNSNRALLARALPFGRDAVEERDIKWKNLTGLDKRKRYCRVWIDVSKLDAMLRLVPSDYVGCAGENGILGKYTGVDDFVRSGKDALYMPKAAIHSPEGNASHNVVYIRDGRHRFAWMRDHGAQAVPVAAPADEACEIAKFVGTKLRVCRVTMRYIPEWRYDPINHVRL